MKNIAFVACALLFGVFSASKGALASDIHVNALVEGHEFFLGESFIYQIRVSGSDNPERPDISGIQDFHVEFLGGRNASSQSVTIIGGEMTRTVKKEFIFSYRLTPRKTGELVIPSLKVNVEGREYNVPAMPVNVLQPTESDDFKLRLSLSKDECYVGEPVILDVRWYFARDVRSFSFNLPVLGDEDLKTADVPRHIEPGAERYEIPVGGRRVVAVKGQGELDGRIYATLHFQKALIPSAPGVYEIDNNTVLAEAFAGRRDTGRQRRDDFFSDFFSDSFFGRRDTAVYRRVVVPSNSLKLNVLPLPREGRPANFAGHVGEYRIAASASPTEVNVGDPIALTVTISGPSVLEGVSLPDLHARQELVSDFRISREPAHGTVEAGRKVFQQTIRASHAGVKAVPPLELPYFDVAAGEYRIARTAPIPLQVNPTRVVTAYDAEGGVITRQGREIADSGIGIAHNYEGPLVLRHQALGLGDWLGSSPFVIVVLCLFPGVYFVLLTGTLVARRRSADPAAFNRRRAYREFQKAVAVVHEPGVDGVAVILAALQKYFGAKLGMPHKSLTFGDVEGALRSRGVDDETLAGLLGVFKLCETTVYAGAGSGTNLPELAGNTIMLVDKVEKVLR